jgi:hypothetical protein
LGLKKEFLLIDVPARPAQAGKKAHPESDSGPETRRMTRTVLRTFSRHHLPSHPLMSRAVAKIQSSDPSFWQVRAAQARRIARMLLGRDAEMVLAYARKCDEQARALSAKIISSSTLLPATASRIAPPMESRVSAGRRAA